MRVLERSIEVASRSDCVRVWALADIHLGNALCDEAHLQAVVRKIAEDPLSYWIGLGDFCDFINRRDPRFRESLIAPWLWGKDDLPKAQRERLLEVLGPIRGKCLALVKGNHEDDILRRYEVDVYGPLVEAMKVDAGQMLAVGVQGFLVLRLVRSQSRASIVFYLHHGYTGGRLPGAKALALGRLSTHYDFDVALMGHSHVVQVLRQTRLSVATRGRRVIERPRVSAVCGTFLRGWGEAEQYSEIRGYPPSDLGPVVIELTPFHGARFQPEIRVKV